MTAGSGDMHAHSSSTNPGQQRQWWEGPRRRQWQHVWMGRILWRREKMTSAVGREGRARCS
jgi:hypothetical protein